MTDRGDRGARRLKAAWNRLADRVRARMEHVPPNGTAPVAPASGGTDAPMVDRLTARLMTLECDIGDERARAEAAEARVRELEERCDSRNAHAAWRIGWGANYITARRGRNHLSVSRYGGEWRASWMHGGVGHVYAQGKVPHVDVTDEDLITAALDALYAEMAGAACRAEAAEARVRELEARVRDLQARAR
jgi:hypothetical protein